MATAISFQKDLGNSFWVITNQTTLIIVYLLFQLFYFAKVYMMQIISKQLHCL